jgi:hypothetical protein
MDGFARNNKVGPGFRMPADNKQDYEQKIRRLRDLAAEVRLLAADMRHYQSRASLLQIAAAYDDLAGILSRLASSPNWLTFSSSSPSSQPPATKED